ncbi:MAG: AraC family transcriptional regulator [Lachnospiraceae bacterium]
MKKNLQTKFSTRQYMLSRDFEIYYYNEAYQSQVDMHSHSYYEFYFFLEGDISMRIADTDYALEYGDLVLIPPGVRHQALVHDFAKPYRRFVFWITEDYCNQLMNLSSAYVYLMQFVQVSKKYIFHNDLVQFNNLQFLIFQLIGEIRSDRFGREAKIALYVDDLILQLNRIVHEQQNPETERGENALSQNLIYFIDSNLEKNITLEDIAKEFYMSKYHLSHIFKDTMGLSIHQYVLKKKMQASREAILSNETIGQVCLRYGFKDYSSFYRAFKKEYGMSPKEYKKNSRKAL